MTDKVDVIDISHWQETVDFNKIRNSGVVGVILKATEGSGNTDKTFKNRYKAAREAGLQVSSYHFLRPGSMSQQMERYLKTVNPRDGERVCIDHEDRGVPLSDLRKAAQILMDDSRGLQVTIYSGFLIKEQLGNNTDDVLAQTSLWLAHYSNSPSWPKATWPQYSLWQYSDKGSVPGVSGNCDVNHFNGSAENCERWMTPQSELEPGSAPELPAPATEGDTMSITINTTAGIKVKLVVNGEVLLLP